METLAYKTVFQRKEDVQKDWLVIDATNQVLGRLSTKVAMLLRGKHKPSFTPHNDGGDYVIVLNADKVRLTGNKLDQKTYISHSGYPGGQKITPVRSQLKKDSRKVIEEAVRGMLPKNRLGRQLFGNLHVYAQGEHAHAAQKPKEIKL